MLDAGDDHGVRIDTVSDEVAVPPKADDKFPVLSKDRSAALGPVTQAGKSCEYGFGGTPSRPWALGFKEVDEPIKVALRSRREPNLTAHLRLASRSSSLVRKYAAPSSRDM